MRFQIFSASGDRTSTRVLRRENVAGIEVTIRDKQGERVETMSAEEMEELDSLSHTDDPESDDMEAQMREKTGSNFLFGSDSEWRA